MTRERVTGGARRRHAGECLLDHAHDAERSAPPEDRVEAGMRRLDEIVEHRRERPFVRGGRWLEAVDRR
jgi:hypothetical protein